MSNIDWSDDRSKNNVAMKQQRSQWRPGRAAVKFVFTKRASEIAYNHEKTMLILLAECKTTRLKANGAEKDEMGQKRTA